MFAAAGDIVLAPLPVCEAAHLRERDLPRVADSSPLGELIAHHCRVWAEQEEMAERGRAHTGFPHVHLEDTRLAFHMEGATLMMTMARSGRPATVLRDFDAAEFDEYFLGAVCRAGRPRS